MVQPRETHGDGQHHPQQELIDGHRARNAMYGLREGRWLPSAPRTDPRMQRDRTRLLPQMLGVEAPSRIRMENFGHGKPLLSKTSHMLPRHPAFLTTTSNNAQPALAHLEPKGPETGGVSRDGMIVEVALNHAPQPFPDFRQWLMHAPPKRDFHLFQLSEESLSDGLAQHEELAVLPGPSADVREPQEVKRLRLALASSLSVLGSKTPELNQACLIRM